MTDYRPLPDEQRDVFHEYVSYAFAPEEGPSESEYDPEEEPERAKLGSRRGLYPDEESADTGDDDLERPLCVCRHHWFDARVRGDIHAAPGLSAVATPPENRRSGFVRDLLRHSLAEYRDRGARFSVLWPFEYGFYRQYGWDTCNKRTVYECDPETLAFAADERRNEGSFSRLEADDYESLAPTYEAHSSAYGLSLERDEEWWRHRVFSSWETDPFVYAWERDGEVRGYLTYTVEEEDGRDEPTMAVTELAFVDHEAHLALLSFCANHDSQVGRVRLPAPEESRLLDLVGDPHDVDCTVKLGPMVRIVDVAETLSALSYAHLERAEESRAESREPVTLAVEDPLVEWNDGVFSLGVSSESDTTAVACEPVTTDPDATIDVGALSQLAVGYRSARTLRRAGRLTLDGSEERVIERLETLFPTTPTPGYLRDFF
ncbi:GNAT family N-acetyltransferase [Natronoglomus mannanivorans]|uniref:GNAT family N-acetyltransferase n=1 Tax=Natronoglomus mannanivorans TaxID=2979990 RepID=A0AAP2YW58_9EURY|nr:GNAT family N-acetyltransferase [Halobacteria archaeon AArc-xg1-1]